MGPAYLVSVGYMDPGNWATDIAAGSKYGYSLLWVIVLSNITAILVQSHSARLGIVTGKDIAQFSRSYYSKSLNFVYWVFAEIAIAATDLAEILGMAIGLKLLVGLNMLVGVSLSLFDTFIIMFLVRRGIRSMEAIIIGLISIIGVAFVLELLFSKPDLAQAARGIVPFFPQGEALYIAIGIIGATVMPHNLYLHSSLVQTRKFNRDNDGKSKAIKYNFLDTVIALNLALFVNAAILILAASTFFATGRFEVADIMDAHKLLAPILGVTLAPTLFAIALIASGQSSTLTGTLTGQIIMEGYLNLRLTPWLRRLITRLLAVIPAFLTILIAGERQAGALLILSQVILSLQLGYVVVPLLHWVSSKKIMGSFAVGMNIRIVSWAIMLLIIYLNLRMALGFIFSFNLSSNYPLVAYYIIYPAVTGAVGLLLYTILEPLISNFYSKEIGSPHAIAKELKVEAPKPFSRIAIGVDFSPSDLTSINYALKFGAEHTEYFLIHIVESATARVMMSEVEDNETRRDIDAVENYAEELRNQNYRATAYIGFGQVEIALPEAVRNVKAELLVLSTHHKGPLHRFFKGSIINKVQRSLRIPIFIAK